MYSQFMMHGQKNIKLYSCVFDCLPTRVRLLASSCLPVCLSARPSVRQSVPPLARDSAPTRRVFKENYYFSKIGR